MTDAKTPFGNNRGNMGWFTVNVTVRDSRIANGGKNDT